MQISYTLIRSRRRTIALQITGQGLVVRAPLKLSERVIREFVECKRPWVEQQLAKLPPALPPFTQAELKAIKAQAAREIPPRVKILADQIGITYGRISLRWQKTRWGSCSAKGNLNFNCLLMLAPPEVRDYVIIHELCHRKELNHSPAFWKLVEQAMPEYKSCRHWLKYEGILLIRRLP